MTEPGAEPHSLIGNAALMKMAMSGIDLAPLSQKLLARAAADPHDANALMDMSTVLQLTGNRELALVMQMQALEVQTLYRLPVKSGATGVRLLALMAPGDLMANTPLDCLLENSDVALDMLYVGQGLPLPPELPDHDLLFVAIGENDQNCQLLVEIADVIKDWPRPVLNPPERAVWTSREGACAKLRSAPGTVMPGTARIERQTLERIGRAELPITAVLDDGAFPIIVRPIESHAGKGLAKLDAPVNIAGYLGAMPQDEFYVSSFIDYRGQDGQFRKYRIVLIDGHPYACHMGISDDWMIHYLNAGMAESAEKRAEEAHFMAGFDEDFGRRHAAAFQVINERMMLDYLIIDCGETPDGKLLIFEVDTSAVVHALDAVDLYPYKQPQMQKVFAAFRTMLGTAVQRNVT